MQYKLRIAWIVVLSMAASMAMKIVHAQVSRYSGEQTQIVKPLSAQEVDDLLNSRDHALATVAELTGYLSPARAVEIAEELRLRPEQMRAISDVKDQKTQAARPLGEQIVARIHELDGLFVSGFVSDDEISARANELGILFRRLRTVHLRSHLEVTAILTASQIARYNELRGYGLSSPPEN